MIAREHLNLLIRATLSTHGLGLLDNVIRVHWSSTILAHSKSAAEALP